jgi:aminopeptidase N
MLGAAEPGSDAQLAWARAVAGAAAADDTHSGEIRALLDGATSVAGLPLDPDLRWLLWTALAATGHARTDDLDEELARDDTAAGHTAWLRCLAARPDAQVKQRAWDGVHADPTLSNDHLDATIAGFRAGGRRDLVAPFDDRYFASLREVWAQRSIEIARRIVLGLFPAPNTLEPVDGWLAANPDAPAALRRLVLEQRDHLARELRVRALNGAVV